MAERVRKSEAEWREQLSPEQYEVTREKGTERAFTGIYWDCKKDGVYRCICCDQELFDSGATLFLTLENASALPASQQLYVVTTHYNYSGNECGGIEEQVGGQGVRALPQLGLTGRAELVMTVHARSNASIALVAAPSADDAKVAAAQEGTEYGERYGEDPEAEPPANTELLADIELPQNFCQEPCGC